MKVLSQWDYIFETAQGTAHGSHLFALSLGHICASGDKLKVTATGGTSDRFEDKSGSGAPVEVILQSTSTQNLVILHTSNKKNFMMDRE